MKSSAVLGRMMTSGRPWQEPQESDEGHLDRLCLFRRPAANGERSGKLFSSEVQRDVSQPEISFVVPSLTRHLPRRPPPTATVNAQPSLDELHPPKNCVECTLPRPSQPPERRVPSTLMAILTATDQRKRSNKNGRCGRPMP